MSRALLESRFLCFAVVGLVATLVHVTVVTVLVELFAVSAVTASVPAFLLAMLCSYIANRRWTFQADGAHHEQLPKYALVSAAGLGLNVLIMYVVVEVMHRWYGSGLALVVITVPMVTYLLNRNWTFGAKAR